MRSLNKGFVLSIIFLTATVLSYISLEANLRITSALVYVMAIVAIAAYTDLKIGLACAIFSSLIYNFFISQPLFRFGVDSYDDVMPLIAFNTTAVFTGVLAGRLSERAIAAENAQSRINALLRTSDKLQQAVTFHDVARDLEGQQESLNVGKICLYDKDGHALGKNANLSEALCARLQSSDSYLQQRNDTTYHVIRMGIEPVAILGFIGYDSSLHGSLADLESVVNLISLAVERCALLKQQSHVEVIRRSEELKTAILSSISHDMRTPLAAISTSASSLSLLHDTLDKAVRVTLLDTIMAQCQRLNRLTTNLLDIGRLQAGLSDVVSEPVDVHDILGAVIASMRMRFAHITLSKTFISDPLVIMANEVMIEQIFANVLDNACRYAPAGTEVQLTTHIEKDAGYVTISDCGPGIADDDLPHLFERFFRGTRTSHITGTGLGLAIARGFVEEFNGSIEVKSPANGKISDQAGPGTSVTIKLPVICASGWINGPEDPDN